MYNLKIIVYFSVDQHKSVLSFLIVIDLKKYD